MRRLLQVLICVGCIVPIGGGLAGVFGGAGILDPGATGLDIDSNYRYLSGLLFGIGLCFLSTVPHIETQTARVRLLTFIVVVGGIARLWGISKMGTPSPIMLFALVMELGVTPALCLFQFVVSQNEKKPSLSQDNPMTTTALH